MKVKIKTSLKKVAHSSHIIPIPEDMALKMLEKWGKRVVVIVNEEGKTHSAISKSKTHGHYIMVGKSTLAKIKVKPGEEFTARFEKDQSEYQAQIPEELEEVLKTDQEGLQRFEALTPGKKRSIIHLVSSAKRVDTRINRALKIVENLKMGYSNPRDFLK